MCRADTFLNLIVLGLARRPGSYFESWVPELPSLPLLHQGPSVSFPLGMVLSCGQGALEPSEAPRLIPSCQESPAFPIAFRVAARHHRAYASQLPRTSPGERLQSGSAVMLSRLFQRLPVSSWLTLRSRPLRSSCHFCCTSRRWASWARQGIQTLPWTLHISSWKPGPWPSSLDCASW